MKKKKCYDPFNTITEEDPVCTGCYYLSFSHDDGCRQCNYTESDPVDEYYLVPYHPVDEDADDIPF